MILNDEWAFVHVPKTGGTAVSKALGGRTIGRPLHAARFEVDVPFAFGFVRNPFDWLVSLYEYLRQKKRTGDISAEMQAAMNKHGFKHWLLNMEYWFADDLPHAGLPPVQKRSQMYWLDGCEDIGRFECLETDLARIARKIGADVKPLERINVTPNRRRHWIDYFDRDCIAHVRAHQGAELEAYYNEVTTA